MEKISSWNLKGGDIVGAKLRPDGTLDTSRALRAKGEDLPTQNKEDEEQTKESEHSSTDRQQEISKKSQEIKDQMLMLEIMQNGSVGIHSSMNNPDWGVGFQNVADEKWLGDKKGFSREIFNHFGLSDRDAKHRNNDEHIREMISLVPAMTEDYKITEVPVEHRGLFGMKTTTMEKRVEELKAKPILHSEAVAEGKDEPMFKLMYAAYGNSDDPMRGRELVYTDDNGRPGNMFLFEVLLPESLVKETMEKLKQDPSFIRKLAGEAVVKRTGLKNAEKMWQKGGELAFNIRPPYEEWDKDSGGKFYFVDGVLDKNDPNAFHPENVVSLAELKKQQEAVKEKVEENKKKELPPQAEKVQNKPEYKSMPLIEKADQGVWDAKNIYFDKWKKSSDRTFQEYSRSLNGEERTRAFNDYTNESDRIKQLREWIDNELSVETEKTEDKEEIFNNMYTLMQQKALEERYSKNTDVGDDQEFLKELKINERQSREIFLRMSERLYPNIFKSKDVGSLVMGIRSALGVEYSMKKGFPDDNEARSLANNDPEKLLSIVNEALSGVRDMTFDEKATPYMEQVSKENKQEAEKILKASCYLELLRDTLEKKIAEKD